MIKLKPSHHQRFLIKEIFDVTRYIYNKTNNLVKKDIKLHKNFQDLRNKLVTIKTKLNSKTYLTASEPIEALRLQIKSTIDKNEKQNLTVRRNIMMKERRDSVKNEECEINPNIKEFEKKVSKEIRTNAVKNLCDAYKTALANLKAGNIKFFDISYKKKNSIRQCAELSSSEIKMTKDGIRFCPDRFKEHCLFKIGKRNQKKYGDIIIKSNCDLVKRNDGYYLALVLDSEKEDNKIFEKFCGVDPGVRTFLTTYGSNGIVEYNHNNDYLQKLKDKIDHLRTKRTKRTKKRSLTKIDYKQKNFIDEIHWKSINSLLKSNDIIFFGDIKSHNIVKGGKNKKLNRQMNELKFYIFKTRLLYKANLLNKKVIMINEAYTTQGCSCCGNLWKSIGSSKIYNCINNTCDAVYDRDVNSAKNILLKGFLS